MFSIRCFSSFIISDLCIMKFLLRRKIIVLLIASILGSTMMESCRVFQRRQTCPAYMNGGATGTMGAKDKPRQLMPKKMRK